MPGIIGEGRLHFEAGWRVGVLRIAQVEEIFARVLWLIQHFVVSSTIDVKADRKHVAMKVLMMLSDDVVMATLNSHITRPSLKIKFA